MNGANGPISQVLEAEPYPFFADSSLGRYRGTQRLELVGREGVVSILCKQDRCLSVTPALTRFKIGFGFSNVGKYESKFYVYPDTPVIR